MAKYRLGDIAPVCQGMVADSNQCWLLNLDVVESNTGKILEYVYVDHSQIGASTVSFDKMNVLYSKLRPYLNKVVLPDRAGYATSEMLPLRPNEQVITREYLTYFLRSPHFVKYINGKTSGAKMPRANIADLKAVEIECPSIMEQNRITTQFDLITRVIEKRQKELSTFDNLIKARFVELLGDPRQNPNGYEVHELSEYIEFLTSGSRGWAKYCVDDGKEWFITIKNVKDCKIATDNMQPVNAPDNAEAKRTRVQEGDLLISITADLGRTGVITKEIADHGAYINQHLTLIRLNQEYLEPLYVAYFMESTAGKEQFISKNQSAVKAGLNFNSINTLKLLVPPKDIQQEFLSFVAKVDKSKSHKKTNYKTNNKLAS
jgi:type I restriction enzyme S subunit